MFLLTGLDIDDSLLPLIWIGMYFSEQLCLAVSLISTAANSAWNGEIRIKCRKGVAGTVVGWQEGTYGKGEWLLMIHVSNLRLAAHAYTFSVGWFVKVQSLWCPRNQVSSVNALFWYVYQIPALSAHNALLYSPSIYSEKEHLSVSSLPLWFCSTTP